MSDCTWFLLLNRGWERFGNDVYGWREALVRGSISDISQIRGCTILDVLKHPSGHWINSFHDDIMLNSSKIIRAGFYRINLFFDASSSLFISEIEECIILYNET